jgi:hypothetical protein
VALLLFAPKPAHSEDGVTPRVLKIVIYATSPKHPTPYEAYRMWMPFETMYTCQEGLRQIDLKTLAEAVQRKLTKLTVVDASAECVEANPNI